MSVVDDVLVEDTLPVHYKEVVEAAKDMAGRCVGRVLYVEAGCRRWAADMDVVHIRKEAEAEDTPQWVRPSQGKDIGTHSAPREEQNTSDS